MKESKNPFSKAWTKRTAIKTIKDLSNTKKLIQETERHSKAIEEIWKKGKGIFLRPFKKSGKDIKKRREKQKK